MDAKKAITLVAIIALVWWVASCAEEGPGMDNSENTNSAFRVNELVVDQNVDLLMEGGGTVAVGVGNSVINGYDHTFAAQLAVDFVSQNPDAEQSKMTGINVTHYRVNYISDDPRAVPLDPIEMPIGFYIEPAATLELDGYVAMPSRHYQDYLNKQGGDIPADVIYEFRFTFYGVNQFGQEVQVKASDYGILNQYIETN